MELINHIIINSSREVFQPLRKLAGNSTEIINRSYDPENISETLIDLEIKLVLG